jgi:hypothetical protein
MNEVDLNGNSVINGESSGKIEVTSHEWRLSETFSTDVLQKRSTGNLASFLRISKIFVT